MRILVLGGDGMLGHQLFRQLQTHHETRVTLRQEMAAYAGYQLFVADNSYAGTDVRSTERLMAVLTEFRPDVIVNAIGIVKQRDTAKQAIPSIEINALLPHRLALACRNLSARLIHISTDCVFSGTRGAYSEDDAPDATDLYGRSKSLGEVTEGDCATLRSSIIGLELARRNGLIEWFLAQQGTIKGYDRAIFTGLTTQEMARVIERIIVHHQDLTGLWQLASMPISKYELLSLLCEKLGRTDITIERDRQFHCDRSLDGSRFVERTGYMTPSWDAMLTELARDVQARGNQG